VKSAAQRPTIQKPAASKPRVNGNGNGKPRPALDEWGLYDPAKAGFGALYAKLEEIEDSESLDDADSIDATDEATPAIPLAGRNPRPLSMWAWRTDRGAATDAGERHRRDWRPTSSAVLSRDSRFRRRLPPFAMPPARVSGESV
jgi:hypothetical protein